MCRWPHRSMASWSTGGMNRYHQSRFLMDDIRMKPCDTRGVLWFIRLVQSPRVVFWLVGSMRVRGSVGGSTQSWKLQPKEVLLPQPTFYGTTLKPVILEVFYGSFDSYRVLESCSDWLVPWEYVVRSVDQLKVENFSPKKYSYPSQLFMVLL